MIKFNVNLSDEIHKRFKVACAQEGKDMSEVIRKCIEDWVEKIEKKQKR